MANLKMLSSKRVSRIREQGYFGYTDQQICELAFGNRFAYRFCVALLIPAVIFANIPLLVFMNLVAFSSIFLPYHPFDYLYNNIIRRWTNGPKLPPRSRQLKFACLIASSVIASTIYFFAFDMMLAGYIMGFQLIGAASLAGIYDICIPSKVFNFFVGKPNQFSV